MRMQYLSMLLLTASMGLAAATASDRNGAANPIKDRSSEAKITIFNIEHDVLMGRWQDAMTHSDAVLSSDKKSEVALFIRNLGRQITFTKYKSGEALSPYDYPFTSKEASRCLEEWIGKLRASEPNNPNVLCAVGAYYVLAKKDTKQATKILERVIAIDPTNVFAPTNVAAS